MVFLAVNKRPPFPNKRGVTDGHRAEIPRTLVGVIFVVLTPQVTLAEFLPSSGPLFAHL